MNNEFGELNTLCPYIHRDLLSKELYCRLHSCFCKEKDCPFLIKYTPVIPKSITEKEEQKAIFLKFNGIEHFLSRSSIHVEDMKSLTRLFNELDEKIKNLEKDLEDMKEKAYGKKFLENWKKKIQDNNNGDLHIKKEG